MGYKWLKLNNAWRQAHWESRRQQGPKKHSCGASLERFVWTSPLKMTHSGVLYISEWWQGYPNVVGPGVTYPPQPPPPSTSLLGGSLAKASKKFNFDNIENMCIENTDFTLWSWDHSFDSQPSQVTTLGMLFTSMSGAYSVESSACSAQYIDSQQATALSVAAQMSTE